MTAPGGVVLAVTLLLAAAVLAVRLGGPRPRDRLGIVCALPRGAPRPADVRSTRRTPGGGQTVRIRWNGGARAPHIRWNGGARAARTVAVTASAILGLTFGGPVAAVFAGTYTALVVRSALAALAAGRARRAAAAVDDLVSGLADDLRAGLPPGAALSAGVAALADAEGLAGASSSSPSVASALLPVTHAAATGEDVPMALRRCTIPGAGTALARLAAAWEVADTSGAPLADVLARAEADLKALRHRRDLVSSHVAASMATVRMLAVLPVVGIGIGYTLGGNPLQFLLRTFEGAVCALLALVLQVSGLLWAERVSAAPARSGST